MANRPILRNALEARDFLGGVGPDEVHPVITNQYTASRYSTTPSLSTYSNQVPAPTRSAAMVMLIKGLANCRLDQDKVQLLHRYDKIPLRGLEKGQPPYKAEIADRRVPGRCPDLGVSGREEQDQILCPRKVPQYVTLSCHRERVYDYLQIGQNLRARPAMRQEFLPSLRENIPLLNSVFITNDKFSAIIEEYLYRWGRPLEDALFSVGEPLTERVRTALLLAG